MIDIAIREAEEGDLPQILDIYNHAVLNTTAVYLYEPQTMAARKQWLDEKKASNFPVFVAERNGIVAGFASYGPFRPWPAYKYSVEHKVYVHPDCRRQGIACKLMAAIIASAKEKKMHVLIAGIDADNAISIELHRQLGFVEVAHFKAVGFKFDRWLDLKFMQLLLGDSSIDDPQ